LNHQMVYLLTVWELKSFTC